MRDNFGYLVQYTVYSERAALINAEEEFRAVSGCATLDCLAAIIISIIANRQHNKMRAIRIEGFRRRSCRVVSQSCRRTQKGVCVCVYVDVGEREDT